MSKTLKAVLFGILPGFFLLLGMLYVAVPDRSFQSDEEAYEFARQYLKGVPAVELYADLLARNPNDSRLALAAAQAWSEADQKERVFLRAGDGKIFSLAKLR